MIKIDIATFEDSVNSTLSSLLKQIEEGIETGLEKSAVYCEGQARKLAQDRIYSKPVPTLKSGKPKYIRTGLYRKSIKGTKVNGKWCLTVGSLAYGRHLEYKCGYMILTTAVFNNKAQIRKIIKDEIRKAGK